MAAVFAVALIVALGVYLAPRLTAEGGDGDCDGAGEVSVATPADLSGSMKATVRTMLADAGADPCVTIDVATVYPDSALKQITSNSNSTPTVWILDSSARLAELKPDVRQKVDVVGKAASTPIILVASRTTSQTPPASWKDTFASHDYYMHPPSISTPESLFAIAALEAEDPDADLSADLTGVVRRLDALDEELPSNREMIRESQHEFGPARLFPVTEQTFARVANSHTDWQLTPMLPDTGTVLLDYPVVVRTDGDPAAIRTAQQLTDYVDSPLGNSALATAGFRGPNGRILNMAAYAKPFKLFPTPTGLTQLMDAWGKAQTAAG